MRILALLILPLAMAHAGTLPQGYVVHRHSTSPDGRYGVVVPGPIGDSDDTSNDVNYLAEIQGGRMLGKIDGGDYFENENHAGLNVTWAATSDCCALVYDSRFGFEKIFALELSGTGFRQFALGEHIEKALMAAAGDEGFGSAFFRFAPGGKLLVRALYYTGNPKLMDEHTHYSRFEGAFDMTSGKWVRSVARKTSDWEALSDAYPDDIIERIGVYPQGSKVPEDFEGTIVASDEEKASVLDDQLNNVYQGVRAVLPPGRFEKVKKEQIAWLKVRDAAPDWAAKCALLEARIKALQDLLWN